MKVEAKQIWRYHIPNFVAQIFLGTFLFGGGIFMGINISIFKIKTIFEPMTYFSLGSILIGLRMLLRDPVGYLKEMDLNAEAINAKHLTGKPVLIRYRDIKLVKVGRTSKSMTEYLEFRIRGKITGYLFNFNNLENNKIANSIYILKLHDVPVNDLRTF